MTIFLSARTMYERGENPLSNQLENRLENRLPIFI